MELTALLAGQDRNEKDDDELDFENRAKYSDEIGSMLEVITRCIRPPYRIRCDFWAYCKSVTRGLDIMNPSAGTCMNKKIIIIDNDDIYEFLAEMRNISYEKYINSHYLDNYTSGLTISALLALEVYITLIDPNQ